MEKTYDCRNAIKISKIVTPITRENDISPETSQTPGINSNTYAYPDRIFKRVWPAVILANNLMDKLNTLAKYDSISTYTKNGRMGAGAPAGTNRLKNFNPCNLIERTFTPTKKINDNANVTTIWLVIVKKYGTSPKTLNKNIDMNTNQI